jgi:hypothetical protein
MEATAKLLMGHTAADAVAKFFHGGARHEIGEFPRTYPRDRHTEELSEMARKPRNSHDRVSQEEHDRVSGFAPGIFERRREQRAAKYHAQGGRSFAPNYERGGDETAAATEFEIFAPTRRQRISMEIPQSGASAGSGSSDSGDGEGAFRARARKMRKRRAKPHWRSTSVAPRPLGILPAKHPRDEGENDPEARMLRQRMRGCALVRSAGVAREDFRNPAASDGTLREKGRSSLQMYESRSRRNESKARRAAAYANRTFGTDFANAKSCSKFHPALAGPRYREWRLQSLA